MKLAFLILFAGLPLSAQTQSLCGPDPSADKDKTLGDFAREHRKSTAPRSGVILTEDDLQQKPTIPDITLDGASNDSEIQNAYAIYASTHSRSETDTALRDWYDRQVGTFNELRDESRKLQSSTSEGYYYTQYSAYADESTYDPRRMREQQALAQAGQQADQRTVQHAIARMNRISNSLTKLRSILDPNWKRYEWFNLNLYASQ